MAVLGGTVLVLKPLYQGPLQDVFYAYAGNFAVSFALYFAAINATSKYRRSCLVAASLALLAVETFEATNGFGIMANVYDPIDFIANAAGVGFAVLVETTTTRILQHRVESNPGNRPSAIT